MNKFCVFNCGFNDYHKIISESIEIHENQKLQGFFSQIGMASGSYLNFSIPENLIVIGDLHGDYESLITMMKINNIEQYLKNETNLLIFLGDYIDRGLYSLEVLLFLCKLKNAYPNNVVLLRGNHEAYNHFVFTKFDLLKDLKNKFGNKGNQLYYSDIIPFFDSLSTFCEVENFAILVHGGLPVKSQSFFDNYRYFLSNSSSSLALLEELLWNDPRELPEDNEWIVSNRGIGKYFGIEVTNRWLHYTKCKILIRGHEPCLGYKFDHSRKVVTIFSSKQPYPKHGSAYLRISNDQINKIISNQVSIDDYIFLI